ncbi:MAG: Nif11-like leader peptide family RiPP precursor [Lachnospiraceae bacterium]|nr:Nif11-like leader peptide family RiPP precursor [Lachnospiraceae bacterium]
MAYVDFSKLTKEQIEKAMACKTADELVAHAKESGFEITKEEAEAFLSEALDFELDDEMLQKVSGGAKTCYMIDGCSFKCGTLD